MWFFPGFGIRPERKVMWSKYYGPEGVYHNILLVFHHIQHLELEWISTTTTSAQIMAKRKETHMVCPLLVVVNPQVRYQVLCR